MTYLSKIKTEPSDGFGIDAFGRQRVSNPFAMFDSKQLYDKNPIFWDEELSGAGATSVHSTANAETTMSVGAVSGEFVIRQTKMRFNYQPGKSQRILQTGLMSTEANVTKRIGYFNSNTVTPFDSNKSGIYFENDGTTAKVCIAKDNVIDSVSQSSWNIDTMDGNGPSGVTIDWTKSQIFFMDFEWLGVGRVRMGVVVDGLILYVHEFLHANNVTGVYTLSPNRSLRYEIRSTGGAGSLKQICASVESEGGREYNGLILGIDRGNTAFATGANVNTHPLLSIRLKSTHLDTTVNPVNISMMVTSTADYRWAMYLNPTIAGTDQASWTALSNSSVEYDISRDNTNTLSAGNLIASGYVESGGTDQITQELASPLHLGAKIDGTRDEFVLAVQNIASSNETYYGGIYWRELL